MINREQLWKFIFFIAVFCLIEMPSESSGLTLYSYTNSEGQKIIVSNLEEIPLQYRNNTKKIEE